MPNFENFFPRDMADNGDKGFSGSPLENVLKQQRELLEKANKLKKQEKRETYEVLVNGLLRKPTEREVESIISVVVNKLNKLHPNWKKADVHLRFPGGIEDIVLKKINNEIRVNVIDSGLNVRINRDGENRDSYLEVQRNVPLHSYFNRWGSFYERHLNRLLKEGVIDKRTYERRLNRYNRIHNRLHNSFNNREW